MDFEKFEIVGHEVNYHQRLFLEAWMTVKDPNAGNDHMIILEVYTVPRWHLKILSNNAQSFNFKKFFKLRVTSRGFCNRNVLPKYTSQRQKAALTMFSPVYIYSIFKHVYQLLGSFLVL